MSVRRVKIDPPVTIFEGYGVLDHWTGRIEEQIPRFKNILPSLLKIAGWTQADFARRLGISRQMVNAMIKGKYHLTLRVYLAMRAIFQLLIFSNVEGMRPLHLIMNAFVDAPDFYTDDERDLMMAAAVGRYAACINTSSEQSYKETCNKASECFCEFYKKVIIGGKIAREQSKQSEDPESIEPGDASGPLHDGEGGMHRRD